MVIIMTIYVDGLLFLNFAFDFLLLLTTSVALKRNTKIFNIIIGAFIGSLTILILFLNINSLQLFIIKVYFSILMILFTFGYHDLKDFLKNIGVFYITSFLLGGFLYYLNIEIAYNHKGLIFFNKGLSVSMIFLFIFSPIVLYIYVRQAKMYRQKIKNFYKTNIYIGNKIYSFNGYLDTGNTLSFKGKPVVLTNIKNKYHKKKFLVPCTTVNGTSIIECICIKKMEVEGLGIFKDIYLGYSNNFNISGADILLNGLMN